MTDQKDRTDVSQEELLCILNFELSKHPVSQNNLVAYAVPIKSVEQEPNRANWAQGRMGFPLKPAVRAYLSIVADLHC